MTPLHTLLDRLWSRLHSDPDAPPPRLGAEPIEAFGHWLDAVDHHGLERRRVTSLCEAFLQLALLGDERASLDIAAPVCELLVFVTPWFQDTGFYVDTVADPSGHHRVYVRDEAAGYGAPWGTFPSLEALAHWMLAQGEGTSGGQWPQLDDAWEQSVSSGAFLLENLLAHELGSLWQDVADRSWRAECEPLLLALDLRDASPGWPRRLCFAALEQLLHFKEVRLPDSALTRLGPVHRAFVDHLGQLQQGAAGRVPELVRRVAESEHRLAPRARAWASSSRCS